MGKFGRKFGRQPEAPAQVAYRLDSEKRCRRIADVIRGMLPGNERFILSTFTVGGADEAISSLSYVANCDRDDAARLLTEMLDNWRAEERAHVCEPSTQTSTFLRECVFGMRDINVATIAGGLAETAAAVTAACAGDDPRAVTTLAGRLAVEALAIFDRFLVEAMKAGQDPEAS